MENMVIGFSKSKGFKPFSWAIRLFDRTEYSHVYLKFNNDYYDDIDVYQASKGMVNHLLYPIFLEHNDVVAEFYINITKEEKKHLIKFLRDRLGKPYSLRTVLALTLKKMGIICNKMYDKEKGFICSELVARALASSGKLPYDIDLDKATPKQLYTICKQNFQRLI